MVVAVNEFDIVVVGGGVVGMCAAHLLAPSYRVALIDNATHIPWQSQQAFGLRVSAINLASTKLFSEIGVWQSVEQMRAYPYTSMHVWESGGACIQFDAADTVHDKLGTIVENDVLITALHQGLDALPNLKCFDGLSLESMSVISNHSVLVELSNGDRLTTELLIGADGQASKVRHCMGVPFSVNEYDQVGIVCNVETEFDHQHTAWQCFTEHGPLALLPLSEQHCSIVWSVPIERQERLFALDEQQFNEYLRDAFESKLGALKVVSEKCSFPLRGAQAERFIDQRVALIGDAAHAVHPLAGLGLNLGLEDVRELTTLLANSTRALGSERTLRQYERARKSENRIMQRSFEMIDAVFRGDQPSYKFARSLGVNVADKCLPLKLLFMQRALGVPV